MGSSLGILAGGGTLPANATFEEITAALAAVVPADLAGILTLDQFLDAVLEFFAEGGTAVDAILDAIRQFEGLIPGLHEGGTMTRTGQAIVGERGPELVSLPAGATVSPNIDRSFNPTVNASYGHSQSPETLRLDLEALALMAAR